MGSDQLIIALILLYRTEVFFIDNSTTNFNNNEILKYALDNGMIDISVIKMQIDMNKRKKYLEMHKYDIWKGSDNKYHTYLPNEEKGRVPRKRNTRNELEDVIVEFYKSLEHEPTFEKVFYQWISEKLEINEIGKGTYDRYENDFKRFFGESDLLNAKIKDVDEECLELFIRKTISEKLLSNKAYANLRTLIIGTFKYAKRKKYTNLSISTFFKDLDLSRKAFSKKIKTKESQVFSEDEIPILINWLQEHPSIANYGIILCFQSGIRTGELAGLKFSDLKGNILHVQRQEVKYKGGDDNKCIHEVVNYTKTESGDRYIILPKSALETIQLIRRKNPFGEYMMQMGNKRIYTNTFNNHLYKACDSCGIPRRSMHKIRKTYGTTLIDSNTDESLIMSQMGHSDISTTKKYYYYSNKNSKHNIDQIEKAINI